MKNSFLSLFLAALMLFGTVSCSSGGTNEEKTAAGDNAAAVSDPAPASTEDAPPEEPAGNGRSNVKDSLPATTLPTATAPSRSRTAKS